MLDRKRILDDLAAVEAALRRRGQGVDLSGIEALIEERKTTITETEERRHQQKTLGEGMKTAAKAGGDEAKKLREELKVLSEQVKPGTARRSEP